METFRKIDRKRIFIGISLVFGLYMILNMQEWSRIPAGLLIGAGIIYLAWMYVGGKDKPRKLLYFIIGAFLIRFALGALWAYALPEFGYDNPVNNAGYVMEDAFNRDQAAWTLARSDEPLIAAFQDYSHTDQYGGMLFLSAGVYRYIGGETHQPLMLIGILAAVSSVGVMFVYLIADKTWNRKTAYIAAWFMMLYPEACLLGSSQMREALIPTITLAIIYIVQLIQDKVEKSKIAALILTFFVGFLISIPFGVVMLVISTVIIALPYYQNWVEYQNKWFSGIISGTIIIGSIVAIFTYAGRVYGASYQQYLSLHGSGKLTSVLTRVPEYLHTSIITIYGMFRPLLPAALTNPGNPVWQGIAIWRSLGWTALLFLLLLSTIRIIQEKKYLHLFGFFTIVSWVWIIFSSYRSGGDMWDNPRYRVYMSGIQILLAAWFVANSSKKNPWLRRVVVFTIITVVLYSLWYINRSVYDFGWVFKDIWAHMIFNFVILFIYLMLDIFISKRRK